MTYEKNATLFGFLRGDYKPISEHKKVKSIFTHKLTLS